MDQPGSSASSHDEVRRYLITGGAGNLACQLAWPLCEKQCELYLFDLAPSPIARVPDRCHYLRGDITCASDLLSAFEHARPTTVVHLAAILSGESERERERAWQVNGDATFRLLELAVAKNVKQFFFASSIATFGPLSEDESEMYVAQWPTGLYGVTKLIGERLGHYYHQRHGLDFRCLRLPVVVSQFAPPGAGSAYMSRAFVESYQSKRYTFLVSPDTRVPAAYWKDAVRAIVQLILVKESQLTRRVYDLQAFSSTAEEVAAAIRRELPYVKLDFEPDRAVMDLIRYWPNEVDDDPARRDWKWQPNYDLQRTASAILAELNSDL